MSQGFENTMAPSPELAQALSGMTPGMLARMFLNARLPFTTQAEPQSPLTELSRSALHILRRDTECFVEKLHRLYTELGGDRRIMLGTNIDDKTPGPKCINVSFLKDGLLEATVNVEAEIDKARRRITLKGRISSLRENPQTIERLTKTPAGMAQIIFQALSDHGFLKPDAPKTIAAPVAAKVKLKPTIEIVDDERPLTPAQIARMSKTAFENMLNPMAQYKADAKEELSKAPKERTPDRKRIEVKPTGRYKGSNRHCAPR